MEEEIVAVAVGGTPAYEYIQLIIISATEFLLKHPGSNSCNAEDNTRASQTPVPRFSLFFIYLFIYFVCLFFHSNQEFGAIGKVHRPRLLVNIKSSWTLQRDSSPLVRPQALRTSAILTTAL